MKYCCIKFEESLRRDRCSYPNIRIVKFVSESFVNPRRDLFLGKDKFGKDVIFHVSEEDFKPGPYRFFITCGYEAYTLEMPAYNIDYCPFCGTNLYEFYQADIEANETEGVTFSLRG